VPEDAPPPPPSDVIVENTDGLPFVPVTGPLGPPAPPEPIVIGVVELAANVIFVPPGKDVL
jgi:hypothetical protein